jgi:hypothetical protein
LAYGTPTHGPNDKPGHCSSSNLEFAKKAISFFMPDRMDKSRQDSESNKIGAGGCLFSSKERFKEK